MGFKVRCQLRTPCYFVRKIARKSPKLERLTSHQSFENRIEEGIAGGKY